MTTSSTTVAEQPEKLRIRGENLAKNYRLGRTIVKALRGVSLELAPGKFTALVGPSGSGKSTLLHSIGCIDPPSSGKVYYGDTDIYSLSDSQRSELRAKSVGFIFQTFNLVPVLSVYDNVEYPLLLQKVCRRDRRTRTLEILEKVGLANMSRRLPSYLSGGQRQRVAIARALISQPALVLADEPTANVDSETAREILAIMKKMAKTYSTTFLCATHDTKVMDFADERLSMVDGKIVAA